MKKEFPKVWTKPFKDYWSNRLKLEATRYSRIHHLPDSLEAWEQYREKLISQISQKACIEVDLQLDLNLKITGETICSSYKVKNLYYQSQPGFYVTGNLYIPDSTEKLPGVLVMHGHHHNGRLAENVQAIGHSLAQNGYVALLVDAFGSGERCLKHGEFEYHGGGLGSSLFNLGETLLGMQVIDNMRGISVLKSLPFVDPEKIGATGASGGGNQTMWLAALDQRVKAAVPVVSVGTFESYVGSANCVCELLPDGLTICEEDAIIGLIAPRAIKICNCLKDLTPSFKPSEMLRTYKKAQQVFSLYNTREKLAYQIFNEAHGYWPDIRESMLGWFDLHLKNTGNGAPKSEQKIELIPDEKLMVFPRGERPSEIKNISSFCKFKGQILKTEREKITVDLKEKLRQVLRINNHLRIKYSYEHGKLGSWYRYSIETECGRMLPVLLKPPTPPSCSYIICTASHGKDQLYDSKIFRELEHGNAGLVILDLSFSGETSSQRYSEPNYAYQSFSRHLLWLGHTLMGEWVKDYLCIKEWLIKEFTTDTISFFGYRDTGLAALAAGALSKDKHAVLTDEAPESLLFKNNQIPSFYSLAICLPGILKVADIEDIRKLISGKVNSHNSLPYSGKFPSKK